MFTRNVIIVMQWTIVIVAIVIVVIILTIVVTIVRDVLFVIIVVAIIRDVVVIIIIAFITSVRLFFVERLSLTIKKHKAWIGLLSTGQEMNTFNDFGGHRQCGGGLSVYDTTCRQTKKIKVALFVASRTESQYANGAGTHAVIMWFMCLHIVTKTVFAMTVKSHSLPSHNGAGAQSLRYSICQGKAIQPVDLAIR